MARLVIDSPFVVPHGMPDKEGRIELAELLRENPGSVALLAAMKSSNCARQAAYSVRQGASGMRMFGPPGAYDASTTTMFGLSWIFVSYVKEGKG